MSLCIFKEVVRSIAEIEIERELVAPQAVPQRVQDVDPGQRRVWVNPAPAPPGPIQEPQGLPFRNGQKPLEQHVPHEQPIVR